MTHRPSQPVAGVCCLPPRKWGQTDTRFERAMSTQTPTQTPPDRHPAETRHAGAPFELLSLQRRRVGMMRVRLACRTCRAEDNSSSGPPICAGQTGYVPQRSPSLEVTR